MNATVYVARHYSTGQALRVACAEGRVVAAESAPAAPDGCWFAPGLVDLQVNGFAGVDFQQDNATLEQLLGAIQGLRDSGCATFLLTLITDEWPRLVGRLRHLRALRERSPALQGAIAGWHIEGPFLSAEPGYHGAHDPRWMLDPTPERLRELRETAGRDRLLLTLAPERRGAIEAIGLAKSLGMTVSLGHTNASAATLAAALRAGAAGFTHLGNACPVILDRHDNILWRALDTPGLEPSLIPDGIHVSPPLFRLIHRVLPGSAIHYVSDATAAAGTPPGRYTLGDLTLEVGADRVVRKPGSPQFAGSALRPIDGVFHAAAMLGRCWREIWASFSERPCAFMGLPHGADIEQWPGLCLVKVNSDDQLQSVETIAGPKR